MDALNTWPIIIINMIDHFIQLICLITYQLVIQKHFLTNVVLLFVAGCKVNL